MNFTLIGLLAIFGMLATTLCLMEIGRRFGVRHLALDADGARAGTGTVEAAVFSLMGLLIAFTFSGAAGRFDARRALAVEEANCIGTAWLRLDLLPVGAQPPLRENFRQYTDARLACFRKLPDLTAAKSELVRTISLQNTIWEEAVGACRDTGSSTASMLLLPALNQMFDIASTRNMGAQMHPPPLIYAMMGLLVLASSLLVGYSLGLGKTRNWFHGVAFVLVISLAIYVILDFEFPRIGLIRIHSIDQVLVDLRQSMSP